MLKEFELYLIEQEKSKATIEKYLRDVNKFISYLNVRNLTKSIVIEYKQSLINENYAITSINSMLASINCYFIFINRLDLKVKPLKIQQNIYTSKDKELTKQEYFKLLQVSKQIFKKVQ